VLCVEDLSICHRHRSEAWKCLYGQYAVPVLVANEQTVPTYVLLHAFLNDRFQLTADFDLPFGEGAARVTVWRGCIGALCSLLHVCVSSLASFSPSVRIADSHCTALLPMIQQPLPVFLQYFRYPRVLPDPC
jgi:hypothetical protein